MSKIKNSGLDHALNPSKSSNLEQLALKGLNNGGDHVFRLLHYTN